MDGNWGQWMSWSTCSKTCGGGMRTRKRKCDDPGPSSGGQQCTGKEEEEEDCKTNPCPSE